MYTIDVSYPDPPYKEVHQVHMLQDMRELVSEVSILMELAGQPLNKDQVFWLRKSLTAVLFDEGKE
jgi:hypothetical protein